MTSTTMPRSLPTAPLLGERYRLGDVVGSGGMSRVYRAEDTTTGRAVAVKVLRDWCDDSATVQRFRLEAKALASLDHPHLVRLLDAGLEAQQRYLVLELVEGGTLSDRIAHGPLDPEEVVRLALPLADALAHVHAAGIVHRDLKPSNILLDAHGPHLADFGIARLLDESTRHTATGLLVGTAAYLSPEQAQGHGATPASDIYALGLVLLESLTGEQAYQGTPVEAAIARLHRAPEIPDSLDADWRRLLTAMTSMDPADRPTAAALVEQLTDLVAARAVVPTPEQFLQGLPPVTTHAAAAAPAGDRAGLTRLIGPLASRRPGPRRRRSLPVLAAGLALTAGVLGMTLSQGTEAPASGVEAGVESGAAASGQGPPMRTERAVTLVASLGAGQAAPEPAASQTSSRAPTEGRKGPAARRAATRGPQKAVPSAPSAQGREKGASRASGPQGGKPDRGRR